VYLNFLLHSTKCILWINNMCDHRIVDIWLHLCVSAKQRLLPIANNEGPHVKGKFPSIATLSVTCGLCLVLRISLFLSLCCLWWCERRAVRHFVVMYKGHMMDSFYVHLQNCEKQLLALSCASICPHGTAWLLLDGFWWNLIFRVFFPKICLKSWSFIKIQQE
jgi:hypothetical protein